MVAGSDKLLHFLTYAGLSAGFASVIWRRQQLWLVTVGLILYGVAIEFAQGLSGYRMFEFADMVANSVGVVFGLLAYLSPLHKWLDHWEQRRG